MDSVIFLPAASTHLLKTPLLETHPCRWLHPCTCGQNDSDAHTWGISFQLLGMDPCWLVPHSCTWSKAVWPVPANGQRYGLALNFSCWTVLVCKLVLTLDCPYLGFFLSLRFSLFDCLHLLSQKPSLTSYRFRFFWIISFQSSTLLVLTTVIMMIALSGVIIHRVARSSSLSITSMFSQTETHTCSYTGKTSWLSFWLVSALSGIVGCSSSPI